MQFIQYGLGSMGIGMALNLQKHLAAEGLQPLRYGNRTMSRGEPLKAAGATPEESFDTLVAESTILFTMVSLPHCCDLYFPLLFFGGGRG